MTLTTALATEQAIAQHADDPFLVLLTLGHPTLTQPERFVRNRIQLTSRGNLYKASHFEVELPGDGEEAPRASITVANVSRRIGQAMQTLVTPPSCVIELVLASTPDTVERVWSGLDLLEATWDAFTVRGTLTRATNWDEPWPFIRVTPARFPGLFP